MKKSSPRQSCSLGTSLELLTLFITCSSSVKFCKCFLNRDSLLWMHEYQEVLMAGAAFYIFRKRIQRL
jgi:hypothetical protein